MKKLIYICFVSFLIIVNSNAYKTNLENSSEFKKPIGFSADRQSEFIKAKSLNALTVQLPGLLPSSELKNIIRNAFSDKSMASAPDFLGYYIIDEPRHKNKWKIILDKFRQFYDTVKAIDSNIAIIVNFGYLECMEDFIMEDPFSEKITDIAVITISPKKLKKFPNYMGDTIEDIVDHPEYIKAFRDVFKTAIKKFGLKRKVNRRRVELNHKK